MIDVAIIYGGRSGEHDVSLCSAASVFSALDKEKYNVVAIGVDRDGRWYVQENVNILDDSKFGKILDIEKNGDWLINHFQREDKLFLFDKISGKEISVDVVFPVMHGTFCEDGSLQGLLDLAMVPYVGADVLASSVGMDKDVTKRLLRDAGIPVVDWLKVISSEWESRSKEIVEEVSKKIGFPLFVKPANAGSSVGVSKVDSLDLFSFALEEAFKYDNSVLVEKSVNCKEIECAVLGNDNPQCSVLGEIRPKHEFYSYEAKYEDNDGAEFLIPANLDGSLSDEILNSSKNAYVALNCKGLARLDFFVENDKYYFNEINTLPGFTSISMYPKLWENSGLSYAKLLDRLIELAFQNAEKKKKIK